MDEDEWEDAQPKKKNPWLSTLKINFDAANLFFALILFFSPNESRKRKNCQTERKVN